VFRFCAIFAVVIPQYAVLPFRGLRIGYPQEDGTGKQEVKAFSPKADCCKWSEQ